MTTASIIRFPSQPDGWRTVDKAEKAAKSAGMSPVPLRFKSKLPICKSHPALSFMQLGSEIAQLVGPGYKYGLGIVGGYGGYFAVDVDIDDGQGRALVERHLGSPLGVIRGNPQHLGKLLYLGPWVEPDPEITKAARTYFTHGLVYSRAERQLAKAKQSFGADHPQVVEADKQVAGARAEHERAHDTFSRLRDAWLEQHKLVRTAEAARKDSAGNIVLKVEIKSFGSIIAMPPSKHDKIEGVQFSWEDPPILQPGILECVPRVTREQVESLLREIDGKDHSGKLYVVNGDARQPHVGPPSRDPEALATLERLTRKLTETGETSRNTELNRSAFILGQLVPHRLDESEIETALHAACSENGLLGADGEEQWRKTFRSGLKAGMARPTSIGDALVESYGDIVPPEKLREAAGAVSAEPGAGKKKQSSADLLVKIASTADLYHAPDGTGFADVTVNGIRQTWPVASRGFKNWLRHAYHEKTEGAPSSEAMQAAMGVIEARCQFKGREQQTHLRVAAHDGCHYLDLCDDRWRSIAIDVSGWRIVDSRDLPVRFRRTRGMMPLPVPEKGGSIDELRQFLNFTPSHFVLSVGWLMATLRGEGQRPVLALSGEHGSAKSTAADMLRRLVDPSTAQLRAPPRTLWDLYVSAMNAHVLVLDNLSGVAPDVSDALCRLSTGGGFSARQLYSDSDEILFNGQRGIILTGIEELATRPDLIDRTMMPVLDSIPDDRRRSDTELWAAFNAATPRILGALLDAAAHGLRMLPKTKLDRLPRMADFATWMAACEGVLWPAGTFARAYADDQAEAMTKALSADPAIVALRRHLQEFPEWKGAAADLLELLCRQVSPSIERGRDWPKTPRALGGRLNRFAPALRKVNIFVERSRTSGRDSERELRIVNATKFLS